jgi:transcriptional regulator with XRE-family HTH domain
MHTLCMIDVHDFNAMALQAAARAKQLGLTQGGIATALGASQSQVSRVLSGLAKRHSKLLDAVCKYVFSHPHRESDGTDGNHELMQAISDVWDGTPQHAHALATVIRSLSLLQAPSTAQAR